MNRRQFLKKLVSSGAGTVASKVEQAANPVPKIQKTLSNAQDIAATVKAVPTGKQTRRQFLNSAKKVGTRVASKKKLPQKAIKGATKAIGYVADPKSLAVSQAAKRNPSRLAKIGQGMLGIVGMKHKPMLLSNFARKKGSKDKKKRTRRHTLAGHVTKGTRLGAGIGAGVGAIQGAALGGTLGGGIGAIPGAAIGAGYGTLSGAGSGALGGAVRYGFRNNKYKKDMK